jgi:hypothetical protein
MVCTAIEKERPASSRAPGALALATFGADYCNTRSDQLSYRTDEQCKFADGHVILLASVRLDWRDVSEAKAGFSKSGKGRVSAYGAKLHKQSAEVSSLGHTCAWLTILCVTPKKAGRGGSIPTVRLFELHHHSFTVDPFRQV